MTLVPTVLFSYLDALDLINVRLETASSKSSYCTASCTRRQSANPVPDVYRRTTFPSLVGNCCSSRLVSPWICCRSLISRLVSSPGKQLHLHLHPRASSTAVGELQLHWPSRPACRSGATRETHHSFSALDKPLSPIPRHREVSTLSRADDPHPPDLSTCSRQGNWSPLAGPFPQEPPVL